MTRHFTHLRAALTTALALGLLVVPASQPTQAQSAVVAQSSPTLFVQNVGQWPSTARYQAQANGGTLWLTDSALWLTVAENAKLKAESSGVNLKLSFVGANTHP